MISPPYLKAGDKVALVASARKVSRDEMEPAIRILRDWGLDVVPGVNLYNAKDQFAGSDEERLYDLQSAMDDESVRAIFFARGGYGTVRILDSLDFSRFCSQPKWLVGYSDITVLHSHVNTCLEIETLHASMPINFARHGIGSPSLLSLHDALMGKMLRYSLPSHPLDIAGSASGKLFGGNLSILYSLNGSPSFKGGGEKLLFIEDVDEYLYHIDRMMQNLLRSGTFEGLKGLLVGGMTDMRDNEVPFGRDALQIVSDTVSGMGFPLAFQLPSGHGVENFALIMGRTTHLETGNRTIIEFAQS
jgi:muramoyltetrapeptide carboxypeptidase